MQFHPQVRGSSLWRKPLKHTQVMTAVVFAGLSTLRGNVFIIISSKNFLNFPFLFLLQLTGYFSIAFSFPDIWYFCGHPLLLNSNFIDI